MATWKQAEREIANRLGGERVPVTGRQRGSAPDIEHEWLSLEVKHRKKLPGWMLDAIAQAETSKRDEQLPMVVLHQNGQRYDDSVVMLRLKDFTRWFGK